MLNSSNIAPTAAITAVVLFGVYRRAKRSIGRQKLTAARPLFAIAFFTILAAALAFVRPLDSRGAAYLLSGLIVGAAIGWFALRHTAFEVTAEGYYYTPHLYIGIAITALFIGRMLYRLMTISNPSAAPGGMPSSDSNPLTLGITFLTASYYIVYGAGLMRWLRAAPPSAPAPQVAPSTSV